MRINPGDAAGRSLTGPRPQERCGGSGRKILLFLLMLLAAATGAFAAPPAPEAPAAATLQEAEPVTGPLNYDRAVRLAIRRSPYFTRSSLEIEVKRLDEKDSKFDMVPGLTFRTQYYVNQPSDQDSRPYSLSFASRKYNPLESYFTLQARKMFTQIAILAHMQVVAEGIQKLGQMFLQLDALNRTAAWQQELVDLARRNLDYFENRSRIGTGTTLEVRVATQELAAARAEQDRIASSRKRLEEKIKAFIGLKPHQTLELDWKEARRQVTGGFDINAATLGQARNRSYLLKIAELRKELQNYNIMMAKARLLPSVYVSASTPDPLSGLQSRDLFFSVGLEVPVWDGFKRVRNISRQKTVLRQYGAETEEKDLELADKWNEAKDNLHAAEVARKAALAREELARLKERQSEIRYHSGGEPLPVYLEGRKGLIAAQNDAFMRNLDCDLALLRLRHLSGDLGATYVDANSWQQ